MKPNKGKCIIGKYDCVDNAPIIQKTLGYIPGEITFPDGMKGDEFLSFMNEMRGIKKIDRMKELLDIFQLDPKGKIKRFSKGMKQKLAIVSAFMHNPEVLILDEPTSGLDPLMQNHFIDLILNEKKKGKTILISSHIFEEVEKICDNVLIIKEGRIVKKSDVFSLKSSQRKVFSVKVEDIEQARKILSFSGFDFSLTKSDAIEINVSGDKVDTFIKTLAQFKVLEVNVAQQSLEDVFMDYYSKEAK